MTKVNAGSAVSRGVFNLGWKIKGWPILGSVADAIVFSKVRQATGGRLSKAMSGGSALNNHTREYLEKALSMRVFQGELQFARPPPSFLPISPLD